VQLNCLAQEFIKPVITNELLQHSPTSFVPKKTRAINLPFVDDFSYKGPYPDATKWMDNKVFVNNTFGVGTVTQGVATFDGLNEFGASYSPKGTATMFKADSLTSQEIDLSAIVPSDSLYLSFFVQPQGNGFKPELLDSFSLFFLDKNFNWQLMWGRGGASLEPFSQIMIRVVNDTFYHNAFQFRFINIASPNTNDDVWNLDYVKLAKNRSRVDTVLNDLAFAQEPSSILLDYTSMPYRHFKNYTGLEQALTFQNTIHNNYKVAQTVGVKLLATELTTNTTLQTDNVNVTVPINGDAYGTYNAYTINYFPPNPNDDVTIRHKYYYGKLNAAENTLNDTIVKDHQFSNYFAYDDGTNEKAYFLLGLANTPASVAMQFHVNEADTLRGVAIKFANQVPSGEGKLFSLSLYKSLGANSQTQDVLRTQDFYKVLYTNSQTGFTTYAFDTAVALSPGTYYIGTTQAPNVGADSIYFGLDANTSGNTAHLFYNVDGNWTPSTINGTVMIRPIVGAKFTPTGLASVSKKINIAAYPNPVINTLHLQNDQQVKKYCILDMNGKMIQRQNYFQQINVQELPTGQYYLQLFDSNNLIMTNIPFTKQ
jgi:hypothetical protein